MDIKAPAVEKPHAVLLASLLLPLWVMDRGQRSDLSSNHVGSSGGSQMRFLSATHYVMTRRSWRSSPQASRFPAWHRSCFQSNHPLTSTDLRLSLSDGSLSGEAQTFFCPITSTGSSRKMQRISQPHLGTPVPPVCPGSA